MTNKNSESSLNWVWALIAVTILLIICDTKMPKPKNHKYEYGVEYWTDEEGHRMMKDKNGNVRELSNTQQDNTTQLGVTL